MLEHTHRCVHAGAGLKFPELRTGRRVERSKPPVIASNEQQTASSRQGAAVTLLRPLIAPGQRVRRHVEGSEDADARHARERHRSTEIVDTWLRRNKAIVAAAGIPIDHRRPADEQATLNGIVRARRPACTAPDAGQHERRHVAEERREDPAVVHQRVPLGREVDELRHDRIAARERLRRGRLLPRFLRHRLLVDADQRFAGLAIEDIRPAGLADFSERTPRATVDRHVEQHDGIDRVVVPDIVMHLLEVPPVSPGLQLDRHDRRGKQVVTGAEGAVVVGSGVAGRKIEQPERRIDGWRLPDGGPAVLPGVVVLRPGVVTCLTRARDCVERPEQPSVSGVVRLDAAAGSAIAAGEADDHLALDVERCGGDREALLPALGLDRPDDATGGAVQRHQLALELPREHPILADRHTFVVPATAHGGDVRIDVGRVLPEDLAAIERQREHVVGAGTDVCRAVVDDWRGEAGILRCRARAAQLRPPHAFQLADIRAIESSQRRIPLVVEIAAVGRPAGRRMRCQSCAGEILGAAEPLRHQRGDEERGYRYAERCCNRSTHVTSPRRESGATWPRFFSVSPMYLETTWDRSTRYTFRPRSVYGIDTRSSRSITVASASSSGVTARVEDVPETPP